MVTTNPPLCTCNRGVMRLLKSKTDDNRDRWFYRCPFSGKHKGYFKWWDEYHGVPWPSSAPSVDDELGTFSDTVSDRGETFAGSCSSPEVHKATKTMHVTGQYPGRRIHPSTARFDNSVVNNHTVSVDFMTALIIGFVVMVGTIACLYIDIQIGRTL